MLDTLCGIKAWPIELSVPTAWRDVRGPPTSFALIERAAPLAGCVDTFTELLACNVRAIIGRLGNATRGLEVEGSLHSHRERRSTWIRKMLPFQMERPVIRKALWRRR